jgi:Tol biopolymer transport system component
MISSDGGTEPVWSPDGKELFYRSGNRMMAVDVEGDEAFRASRPRVLFEGNYEFSLVGTGRNYDISTDGKRFLMIKPANEQRTAAPTINLVINWFEELRRRVPVGN